MEHQRFVFEDAIYEQLIKDFQYNFPIGFKFTNNQNTTAILIIEEYYFRIESNLTITLIINKLNNNAVELQIVASGGKHGLFGIS